MRLTPNTSFYQLFTWQGCFMCQMWAHMCMDTWKHWYAQHWYAYVHPPTTHTHTHTTFQNPIKLGLWDLSPMPNGFECLHVIHSVRQLTTRLWPWAAHLWFQPNDSKLLAAAEESKMCPPLCDGLCHLIQERNGVRKVWGLFLFPRPCRSVRFVCLDTNELACVCVCIQVWVPGWNRNWQFFYAEGNCI